jgi:hypothetical protein
MEVSSHIQKKASVLKVSDEELHEFIETLFNLWDPE